MVISDDLKVKLYYTSVKDSNYPINDAIVASQCHPRTPPSCLNLARSDNESLSRLGDNYIVMETAPPTPSVSSFRV
jgi:hypothetical protein